MAISTRPDKKNITLQKRPGPFCMHAGSLACFNADKFPVGAGGRMDSAVAAPFTAACLNAKLSTMYDLAAFVVSVLQE